MVRSAPAPRSSDRARGYAGRPPDLRRKCRLVPGAERNPCSRYISARGAVDQIDAQRRELPDQFDRLFDVPRPPVQSVAETAAAVPARPAGPRHHLARQAHPVLQRAAVVVDAPVAERRQEPTEWTTGRIGRPKVSTSAWILRPFTFFPAW